MPSDPKPEHGLPEEGFPYLDMLEINDFFDPALILDENDQDYPFEELALQDYHDQNNNNHEDYQQYHQEEEHAIMVQQQAEGDDNNNNNHHHHEEVESENINNDKVGLFSSVDGEMSDVFLEWLKTNKDSVSANDLRNVKLKKATIESAAKRLGGGKEAMKQLLKLILEWVQTSHLHNKKRSHNNNDNNISDNGDVNGTSNTNNNTTSTTTIVPQAFPTNPTTNSNLGPWVSPPAAMVAVPMMGYPGDPYLNGAPNNNEFNMLESAHSWTPNSQQFTLAPPNYSHQPPPVVAPGPVGFSGYGTQYPAAPYPYFQGTPMTAAAAIAGDKIMRMGPSATKEARKKRMARQRRYLSHHRSHKHHGNGQIQIHQDGSGDHNCTAATGGGGALNPANWVYWAAPPTSGAPASMGPGIPAEPRAGQPGLERTTMQTQNYHQASKVSSMDQRRQVR